MPAPSPDELPDDLEAARKAADDYLDTLTHLLGHQLPKPMQAWIQTQIAHIEYDPLVLSQADVTFGPLT